MDSPPHVPLNRPRALKPGDTLGVVAPSSPFDRRSFEAGLQALAAMGFTVRVDPAVLARQDYLAGADQQRAALIHRCFADPDIDGIICARGGYGATRILPLLDADAIARTPKVFVGFSDITALLGFLVDRCAMVAFHGPTVTSVGEADNATRERFLAALTAPAPLSLNASRPHVLRDGKTTGRLMGGNLTLLCHLTGTPFQPDLRHCILVIEDRGEAPYRIDRMLTQMLQAGRFDGLSGLVLGAFTDCGGRESILNIINDRLGGLGIPMMAGFDVGHHGTNMTLPVGVEACLDTHSATLTFTEPALT